MNLHSRNLRLVGSFWLALAFTILAATSAPAETVQQLQAKWAGKILTRRGVYSGEHLVFDFDGNLRKGGRPGPWTLYGEVQVESVKATKTGIEIDGYRIAVNWLKQGLHGVRDGMHGVRAGAIRIDIDSAAGKANVEEAILEKIFLRPDESILEVAPPWWHDIGSNVQNRLLTGEIAGDPGVLDGPNDRSPYRVDEEGKHGPVTTAPKALYTPDPRYEPFAQSQKFQGTVVLWTIVNEHGTLENIKVQRAIGFGLDDRAVDAVSKWKFQPAMREGVAVPVQINVEVNFRLY